MGAGHEARVIEEPSLRDRVGVFSDRAAAGAVLAEMLAGAVGGASVLLAIPAGGVPVAAAAARVLGWPVRVAVVSKLTPAFNSEVGFGAAAFDGTVRLNDRAAAGMFLRPEDVAEARERAVETVRRRVGRFGPWGELADLAGLRGILIDDGLASGFTMEVAVDAVRAAGLGEVWIAVPTAPLDTARRLAGLAAALYCANLRGGPRFAVADAYRRWRDVSEDEALDALRRLGGPTAR